MLFILKIIRIRDILDNMEKVLKKVQWLGTIYQNILITLYKLIFVMNICACFWKSGADFNLPDKNSEDAEVE